MKGYTDKDLIVELLQFMRSSGRKELLLKDYIRLTESRHHWTKQRERALYKAIHATKAVFVDYVSVEVPAKDPNNVNRTTIQCVRVKRAEVQHPHRLGAVPTEKVRNDGDKEKQKVYRFCWRDRKGIDLAVEKRTAAVKREKAKRPVS